MPDPRELGVWRDLRIDNWQDGGLVMDRDPEILESNELTHAINCVYRNQKLRHDTGYVNFRGVVRGNPRRIVEYVLASGVTERILITDSTFYRDKTSQWQYVTGPQSTTLSVAAVATNLTITVVSAAGFANGGHIGIELDNGLQHITTVNGAPAGNVITLAVAMPSAAAIGRVVLEPPALTGVTTIHVAAQPVPWSDQLVFTNGVDNVKIYTPTGAGTAVDMTGTGLPANMKCETLAFFDNSLMLANNTEGGTKFKNRLRYCAKGDLTLWNTLEAGSVDVLDGLEGFKQLLKLGPYLIGYRQNGITKIAISGSFSKRFQIDAGVSGLPHVSNQCAVDLTDKHIVMGFNKFYFYRGGNAYEELPMPIKGAVFDAAQGLGGAVPPTSLRYISKSEMLLIPFRAFNEVIFANGINNLPPSSARFNVDNGKWSLRHFGAANHKISGWGERTSANLTTDGNTFLGLASPDLKVVEYDYTASDDAGQTLEFQIVTKDYAYPGYIIKMDWAEISITGGSQTFTVEYSIDKGANWVSLLNTVPNGSTQIFRMNKQASARTIRFRIKHPGRIVMHWFNMRYCYDTEW